MTEERSRGAIIPWPHRLVGAMSDRAAAAPEHAALDAATQASPIASRRRQGHHPKVPIPLRTTVPGSPLRLPLSRGEQIGGYEVVAEVGRGGMAAVYAVRKEGPGGFDKLLAVKLLLPHLANDEAVSRTVLDEARIAAYIHHPNVVEVMDIGSAQGVPYILMEYLRGQSLSAVLRKQGLSRGARLHVLSQAAAGIAAAHHACATDGTPLKVIHRDVSPQNVHVGYNGVAKLVDFGIASARGRLTETRSDMVKGKIGYLAPEQILRAPVGQAVDIWALGVVCWEALAGRRLFYAADEGATLWRILNEPAPPLTSAAPDVSRAVARLVAGCLVKDPAQRLNDARGIARELAAAAREEGIHTIEDIAAEMQQAFQLELALEQDRLRAALSAEAPKLRDPEPTNAFDASVTPITPSTLAQPRPRPRWKLALGATVALLVAASVLLALKSVRLSPTDAAQAARSSGGAPEELEPLAAPPQPAATVEESPSVLTPAPPADDAAARQSPPVTPSAPTVKPPTPRKVRAPSPAGGRVGPLQKSPYAP